MDAVGVHWFWFAFAALLALFELVLPSRAMIWVAAAAVMTGIVAWVAPLGPAAESIIFAAFSLAAVFAGRFFRQRRAERGGVVGAKSGASASASEGEDPLHLVGQKARVSSDIVGGEGRVFIGGSEWVAHGPDTHAGALVTVVSREDAVLFVE